MEQLGLQSLSVEGLVRVIVEAKHLLYPVATITDGHVERAQCHHRGQPNLIEEGLIVTHRLQQLGAGFLIAQGWDGGSSDISEEGERLLLECTECFQWHRIPDDYGSRVDVNCASVARCKNSAPGRTARQPHPD